MPARAQDGETLRQRMARLPATPEGAIAGCDCNECEQRRPRLAMRMGVPRRVRGGIDIEARKFGVEIECLAPRSVLGDGYIPDTFAHIAKRLRTQTRKVRSGQYRSDSWGVKHDGSIRGPYGWVPVEIVSPPLYGDEGLKAIAKMAKRLQALGCKVNRSCGLHVHIDVGDLADAEKANIVAAYVRYEQMFDAIMPASRRSNQYCMPMSYRMARGRYDPRDCRAPKLMTHNILLLGTVKDRSELRRVSGSENHAAINTSLEHGTLEFRQHSGTTSPEKIVNWVKLCRALVDRGAKARVPIVWPKPMTPSDQLENFFRVYKIGRGVRAFYRERFEKFAANSHCDFEAEAPMDAAA